tara:strand:+ start:596 stop:1078 length:483 start_codon:yes stop_codon:yes gene_type:complete
MDPNFEVNLTAYEKLDKDTDTTQQTPSSPLLIRKKPKRDKSPTTPDKKKKTRVSASGKKKPKRKTKRKVKKPKRKTKRKVKKPKRKTRARGKGLVNTHYMSSLDREPADIGEPSAEPNLNIIADEILSKLSKENIDILIEKLSEKDKAEILEILDKKLSK